jgi:hypothetical protein
LFLQLSRGVGEFKHKSSHRNSIRCITGAPAYIPEMVQPQPSVMAELHDFNGASRVLVDSKSCPRQNKVSTSKELLHARSNVSGLPTQPRYHLINRSSSVKNPPTVKSRSSTSDFRHQLVGSVERSASTKMGSVSANSSLSDKMSLLRQPRNYQNQNRIRALNRRHKIMNSKGEIDLLSKEKAHDQPDFSLGRDPKAMFDNALVRQNQLCGPEQPNQNMLEQLWSSTCSSTSSGSIDDFQTSSSSDTSDNSNLSSLGVIAKDQWKMTFRKVFARTCAYVFY